MVIYGYKEIIKRPFITLGKKLQMNNLLVANYCVVSGSEYTDDKYLILQLMSK